jgi:hypothetical protein
MVYNRIRKKQTTPTAQPINRKENKMSNQEIFEMLSENESKLFYAYSANPTDEMKAAHQAARNALEAFAKATGCHN